MKRIRLLITAILLIATGTISGTIYAQEGTERKEADKQREEELQKAISEQKKAISEQRKEQDKARKEMEENMQELEKLRDLDVDVDVDESGHNVRIYGRGNRSINPDVYSIPMVPDAPNAPLIFNGTHFYGESTGSSWVFTKNVKETSFKKEYTFDVEKTVKNVSMSISGDCKDGEIKIKVLTPQGKTYSDVVIDEYGNINVRKSFSISDEENQDKTGEWKFQIDSEKATGYFKISFQTY
ncbi:MAG TPA: hypothetical protein VHO46_11045 [Bacteroidales bacterium]|nr:hypothetical protein [Bacteroidales bacterium]